MVLYLSVVVVPGIVELVCRMIEGVVILGTSQRLNSGYAADGCSLFLILTPGMMIFFGIEGIVRELKERHDINSSLGLVCLGVYPSFKCIKRIAEPVVVIQPRGNAIAHECEIHFTRGVRDGLWRTIIIADHSQA
tara:strand:+ start:789 stop:1193 length:405 start_codon:yes stop_codon:yes gene_type:complete